LDISQGLPLGGLSGLRIDGYRAELVERRREVELALIQLDIRLRRGEQHIADLNRMFRERPDDTKVAALSMAVLHVAGRRPDALQVYDAHREQLDQLGLDVSPALRELHLRVLRGDGGIQLPIDVFDAPHALPGGTTVSDTDNAADQQADNDQGPAQESIGRVAAPFFSEITQRAANVNNFGHVNAPGGHFGPRFDSRDGADDDD
jgi:DNA-binding SARP family transcriptional activator